MVILRIGMGYLVTGVVRFRGVRPTTSRLPPAMSLDIESLILAPLRVVTSAGRSMFSTSAAVNSLWRVKDDEEEVEEREEEEPVEEEEEEEGGDAWWVSSWGPGGRVGVG